MECKERTHHGGQQKASAEAGPGQEQSSAAKTTERPGEKRGVERGEVDDHFQAKHGEHPAARKRQNEIAS